MLKEPRRPLPHAVQQCTEGVPLPTAPRSATACQKMATSHCLLHCGSVLKETTASGLSQYGVALKEPCCPLPLVCDDPWAQLVSQSCTVSICLVSMATKDDTSGGTISYGPPGLRPVDNLRLCASPEMRQHPTPIQHALRQMRVVGRHRDDPEPLLTQAVPMHCHESDAEPHPHQKSKQLLREYRGGGILVWEKFCPEKFRRGKIPPQSLKVMGKIAPPFSMVKGKA